MGQLIFEEIGDPQCVEVIQFEELGTQGLAGESAYQYAIRTGMFVGTEVEFYDRVVTEPMAASDAANQAAENADTAAENVGSAVSAALTSAETANLAALNANQATAATNEAIGQAMLATQDAAQAVIDADAATYSATQATNSANSAAINANAAKDATIIATAAANTAKDSATTAASGANAAKNLANDAANLANTKAIEANAAAISANSAAASASQFQNKQSKFFSPKQLIAWDNFDRANVNPIVQAESGQLYSAWKGVDIGKIENKVYKTNSSTTLRESSMLLTIPETKNIGIEFGFMRTTLGHTATGLAIVKDLNNYFFFGQISSAINSLFTELPVTAHYQLIAVIAGVATELGSISLYGVYPSNSGYGFTGTRMTWVARYSNRGRGDRSTFIVQSLDRPSERIEVEVTAYNSTFVTPADYNKIAIITGSNTPVNSYNIANIDL